jgi:hypothetical protein
MGHLPTRPASPTQDPGYSSKFSSPDPGEAYSSPHGSLPTGLPGPKLALYTARDSVSPSRVFHGLRQEFRPGSSSLADMAVIEGRCPPGGCTVARLGRHTAQRSRRPAGASRGIEPRQHVAMKGDGLPPHGGGWARSTGGEEVRVSTRKASGSMFHRIHVPITDMITDCTRAAASLQLVHPRPQTPVLLDQLPLLRGRDEAKTTPSPRNLPRPVS